MSGFFIFNKVFDSSHGQYLRGRLFKYANMVILKDGKNRGKLTVCACGVIAREKKTRTLNKFRSERR